MAEQTYDKKVKLNCVKQNDGNRKNYKSKFTPSSYFKLTYQ